MALHFNTNWDYSVYYSQMAIDYKENKYGTGHRSPTLCLLLRAILLICLRGLEGIGMRAPER